MQRLFDLIIAILILILSSPFWLIALLALLILDFGSPFYRHRRVGQYGREFRLIKFRTMRKDAAGGNLTVAGDSRVTAIGKVLRKLKIDELPQLINVLKGEMAIVGPRPETPEFVATYTPEQREILKFKPGLTDPSSIKYRYEEIILGSYADPVQAYKNIVLPDKLAISIAYQNQRTIGSDLSMIWRTFAAIFGGPPETPDGSGR